MRRGSNRYADLPVDEEAQAPFSQTQSQPPAGNAPDTVQVNVRNLVQQTLSRYPVDFGLLRELIQNADDAGATRVRVDLKTALQDSGRLRSLTVWNDGREFKGSDWKNLQTISQVNNEPNRVGIFGVGFFAVFKLSQRPTVYSGTKMLEFTGYTDESIGVRNVQPCQKVEPHGMGWERVTRVVIPVDDDKAAEGREYTEAALPKLQLFLLHPLLVSKTLKTVYLYKDNKLVVELSLQVLADLPPTDLKQPSLSESPWNYKNAIARSMRILVVRGAGMYFVEGGDKTTVEVVSVELEQRATGVGATLYEQVEKASNKVESALYEK